MDEVREAFDRPPEIRALWAGVLLAPLAFLLNLQIVYTLVTLDCGRVTPWLHVSELAMLALAVGGGGLAWREWRRAGEERAGDEGGPLARSRFLAVLGMLTSALFVLAILAQWLPILVLGPCRQI